MTNNITIRNSLISDISNQEFEELLKLTFAGSSSMKSAMKEDAIFAREQGHSVSIVIAYHNVIPIGWSIVIHSQNMTWKTLKPA